MNLQTKLSTLPGVGYSYSKRLEHLNLITVADLLGHFPFRYEDFSNISTVLDAQVGQKVSLNGELWSIRNVYTKSKKVMTQAIFNDGQSPIELVWFNQGYLSKSLQTGDRLQIYGKLSKYKNKLSIIAPQWKKITENEFESPNPFQSDESLADSNQTLVPVYPETQGITSKWINSKIKQVLPEVESQIIDPLPEIIRDNMLPLTEAMKLIHLPQDLKSAQKARERLSFDELFYIQLATLKVRQNWQDKPLIKPLKVDFKKIENFILKLPFPLTKAQQRVIGEILGDFKRSQPMNRLVQGEVGSGKTVVAAVIAYATVLNSLKALYMAPTEILAFQHHTTLKRLLEPLGLNVGIYTGSKKKLGDDKIPDVVVGTHALLSQKFELDNVGIVIIDEQQRFGVEQRSYLRKRAKVPHFLTMTATPIPRTVALTMYGDLDLSVIDELPKGRQKISTHVVPKAKRDDAYKFVEKNIQQGSQAYIITPLIELSESIQSAKAATHEFERLQKTIFPKLKLGLLHGRLKGKEKEEILQKFKNGEIDILVSTTVVEVGVDIPNATIMLIENAERFGLAQLHQLRGRVGRGAKQSYCLLFSGVEDKEIYSRLKNLEKIDDGLKLAELDLKIRGSGQIFGTAQSGRFELKLASFSDLSLIEKTRNAAHQILELDSTLDNYPQLKLQLAHFEGVMPD